MKPDTLTANLDGVAVDDTGFAGVGGPPVTHGNIDRLKDIFKPIVSPQKETVDDYSNFAFGS